MSVIEEIEDLENDLTNELNAMRAEALERASELCKQDKWSVRSDLSVQMFHARIGQWNTKFVDSIRVQFSDPKDFLNRWINGLMDAIEKKDKFEFDKYGQKYRNSSEHEVARFLSDQFLRKYILNFLKRNFYRNYNARVRAKPKDELWKIWFGSGNLTWGLLLAPAYRQGKWTNDVSEIRRADYKYWTVGHILQTGLIDPESTEPLRLQSICDFLTFYRSIFKRVSNSSYEKAIADQYVQYIESSQNPEEEPFLVPELRYGGQDIRHVYRLDFAVLNSHTMEMAGFELSPASTHIAVSGMRKENKTQLMVNSEMSLKWEKEMKKRNDYFEKFSIPVVTFTDKMLSDIDSCFKRIQVVLSKRNESTLSYKANITRLDSYCSKL